MSDNSVIIIGAGLAGLSDRPIASADLEPSLLVGCQGPKRRRKVWT